MKKSVLIIVAEAREKEGAPMSLCPPSKNGIVEKVELVGNQSRPKSNYTCRDRLLHVALRRLESQMTAKK